MLNKFFSFLEQGKHFHFFLHDSFLFPYIPLHSISNPFSPSFFLSLLFPFPSISFFFFPFSFLRNLSISAIYLVAPLLRYLVFSSPAINVRLTSDFTSGSRYPILLKIIVSLLGCNIWHSSWISCWMAILCCFRVSSSS